jgi:hypothetical protein
MPQIPPLYWRQVPGAPTALLPVEKHFHEGSIERRSLHGTPGQVGFPGFPVERCGFGQLRVVLFRENHISGPVRAVKQEIRVRSEFVTFLSSVVVCRRKAP